MLTEDDICEFSAAMAGPQMVPGDGWVVVSLRVPERIHGRMEADTYGGIPVVLDRSINGIESDLSRTVPISGTRTTGYIGNL